MRRYLLAVAALLAVTTTPALAGYLVIRVILQGGGAGPGAGPGAAPAGPGPAGPRPSGPGGGATPPGPGRPPPGGLQTPGAQPGQPGEDHGVVDPKQSVIVVIPFTELPGRKTFYPIKGPGSYPASDFNNPKWEVALTHALGHTNLFADGQTIQIYLEFLRVPGDKKTKQSEVAAAFAAWQKTPTDAQPLLDLIRDALQFGMTGEAVKYSDALLAASKDAKGATKFGDGPKQYAALYEKLRPKLIGSAARPPDAEYWQTRLSTIGGNSSVRVQGHYALIMWDVAEGEAARRFAQLEDNFRAFFLWHALRGVALEVPATAMLAVLPPTGDKVVLLARGLEAITPYATLADRPAAARAIERLMMPADGFYSPDHDLLVLSPERLDGAGQTFRAQNKQMWREGSNRKDLVAGFGPKIGPDLRTGDPGRYTPEAVARMQTLATVETYLEAEGEVSAVTREGGRQLLYATGLLARHVATPNWLINGSAEYLHRPKGPVFTTKEDGKTVVSLMLATGYGVPNYVLHKHFTDMLARKELMTKGNPELLLRNVLTDGYYVAVRDGEELDAPPAPPKKAPLPGAALTPPPGQAGPGTLGPREGATSPGSWDPGAPTVGFPVDEDTTAQARRKRDRMLNKARAASWALYYYLATYEPDGLRRYFDELKKLPRDLPIDEKTAVATFARAFNLSTAQPEAGKTHIKDFAAAWVETMTTRVPKQWQDLELNGAEPADPNRPMNPFGAGSGGGEGR